MAESGIYIASHFVGSTGGPDDDPSGQYATMWFYATEEELQLSMTPSELLVTTFGNLGVTSDSRNMMGGKRSELKTFLNQSTVATSVDHSDFGSYSSIASGIKQESISAYMVGATIHNLPPMFNDTESTTQLNGFLDCNSRWGLAYDVDVMYKDTTASMAAGAALAAAGVGSAGSTAQEAQASLVLAAAGGWEIPDPISLEAGGSDLAGSTSIWPLSTDNTWLGSFGTGVMGDESIGWHYATTYAFEAIAYDFYNTINSAGGSTDANEALHSNEIFRAIPYGELEEPWANEPGISSNLDVHTLAGDSFKLNHTTNSDVMSVYASRFHVLYNGSIYTVGEQDVNGAGQTLTQHNHLRGPWYTNNYEKEQIKYDVSEACDNIGPQLTTTEFPKRLLNHIQRRKKIPNNWVSAFGYVPGEMYAATAADVYVSGSTDTVSYDPVTGEMTGVTFDADGNPTYSSIQRFTDSEGGYDLEAYKRMQRGKLWDEDGTGGGEDTDVGGTSPDWWTADD